MSYYLYFTKLAFRRIIPMIARLKIVNIRDVSVSDGLLEKKRVVHSSLHDPCM